MLRFYRFLVISLCGLFVSACSLLPGMTLTNPGDTDPSNIAKQTDIQPTLIPITPDLVTQLHKENLAYDYEVGPGDHIALLIWAQPGWSTPGGPAGIQASGNTSMSNNLLQSGSSSGYSTAGSFSSSQSSVANNSVSNSQLSDYLVNNKGYIFLPYLGNVHVAGQTEEQLQAEFTQLYKKYIRDPQISVRVTTFASQQIYVLGEANQQALIALTDTPLNLAMAVANAGGINPNTANPAQIYVIRQTDDPKKPTIYWLNSESPAGMLLAQNFTMQNHDVVFIAPAAAVSWNRVINQLLPSVQTLWYTRSLINNN